MPPFSIPDVPFVRSVLHPSDFSEASGSAFAHALAVGLARKTKFTMLHVVQDPKAGDHWAAFPPVRKTLEAWGLLEPDSPRSAVYDELELKVQKIAVPGNPLTEILDFVDRQGVDLLVLATEGREGLPRWLNRSLAERVARKSKTMTLFVPASARGFVSLEDGSVSLKRILVPVDHRPSPGASVAYAARAARMAAGEPVEVTLLHIGEAETMPDLSPPELAGCTWNAIQRSGEVVEGIAEAAEELAADLIVMSTQGHDGILDALRGSVTEQVLRRANCPLLAVPVD